jgi:hypothetical protein
MNQWLIQPGVSKQNQPMLEYIHKAKRSCLDALITKQDYDESFKP